MIGARLSHYLLLERLGGGGQGIVYRARDERLHRDVAIKVLPDGALAHESDRKQFRKEALSLSRLNHPNIQTIHDFNSQDGVDYLVLELVPGPTLEERIREGPLHEEEIARLGNELAEGLDAAHAEGIYHRDIKPSNLKITASGSLKILDFGLAKGFHPISNDSITETLSGVAGTVPYMAPEQVRGAPPDARSDIHAVGAVLYEMASGRRAFPQDSQPAAIAAILTETPRPIRDIRPKFSSGLERIVHRCLEKDPGRRYQTARELASDLKREASPGGTGRVAPLGRIEWRRDRRVLAAAGVAVAVLAAAALALNAGGLRWPTFERSRGHSLAVLPLKNLSGDPAQDYFADGMTDELITRLAQIEALRVISWSSVMRFKETQKPLGEIAKELGVDMVVEGSVVQSNGRVRISAQLLDAPRDRHIWAESYERSVSNVLALQSDVAGAIVSSVRIRVTPSERLRLSYAPAVNPMALHELLKGQTELNFGTSESLQRARSHFQKALSLDAGYADAYAALAKVYCLLSNLVLPSQEALPTAKAAALMAIRLDPANVSAHCALAYVMAFYDWEWDGAERELRKTLELSPGSAEAHAYLGYLLTVVARFDEALEEFRVAHGLDPLSEYTTAMTLYPLYEGRRYDEAIAMSKRLLSANPDLWNVQMILAQSLLQKGAYRAGIEEMKRARRLDDNPAVLGWLGYALARGGESAEARKLLSEIQERSRGGYVPLYSSVVLYTGLGEKDQAIACLRQGVDDHSEDLVFLKVDPALDPLRPDPRFAILLQRMRLKS